MKIMKFRDQIATVGVSTEDNELLWISLNGFGPLWHNFVQSICGWEKIQYFEQLWDAFVGEKMRLTCLNQL